MKALYLALGIASLHCAASDWVLVCGAQNKMGKLTAEEASNLYLGKVPGAAGIASITLLDQADGLSIREDFYKDLTNKTPAQTKAWWGKMIFTGKAQAPRALNNSIEVKKAVVANNDAIGYIEKAAVDASVRVVYP